MGVFNSPFSLLPKSGSIAESATDHSVRLQEDDQATKQPAAPVDAGPSENLSYEQKTTKKRTNKLKPHERYKQSQLMLDELFNNNSNYKRFFIIKANEECNKSVI